jgi:Fe-S-cluster containining protein
VLERNGKTVAAQSGILAVMRLPVRDQELVQIMDASLAEAARQAGDWLVCRLGCTQCCYGAFAINSLDAMRLSAGMEALRSAEPALAAQVERRARVWIAEFGAEFPGDRETGMIGDSDAERERFEEFANDAAYPALDLATGRCDVYAWRPMTCRVFGPPVRMDAAMDEGVALGHCELCFAGVAQSEIAACEMAVPHELESELIEETGTKGETVVAFALLG